MSAEGLRIPRALDWWRREPGGADWLERLPRLAAECAAHWDLSLGKPFDAHISLVLPAGRTDGTRAVLKLNFPERARGGGACSLGPQRSRPSARAGCSASGAPRRAVRARHPGLGGPGRGDGEQDRRGRASTALAPLPGDHPFRLLAHEAARWAEELLQDWRGLGRPLERELVDEAVAACRELGTEKR